MSILFGYIVLSYHIDALHYIPFVFLKKDCLTLFDPKEKKRRR